MGEWFKVLKTVRPGATYLYLQRTTYRPGQTPKTESRSQGRWHGGPLPKDDPPPVKIGSIDLGAAAQKADELRQTIGKEVKKAKRKGLIRSLALGLAGDRDQYDRPIKSLLNKNRDKKAKEEKVKAASARETAKKGAAEKGEPATAKGSRSASGPSETTGPTTEEG